jgi:hypothetical protein
MNICEVESLLAFSDRPTWFLMMMPTKIVMGTEMLNVLDLTSFRPHVFGDLIGQ